MNTTAKSRHRAHRRRATRADHRPALRRGMELPEPVVLWHISAEDYPELDEDDAYIFGYTADQMRAAIAAKGGELAEAWAGWERECNDTDKLLRGLGLEPEICRTEGGSLNVGRTLDLLAVLRLKGN